MARKNTRPEKVTVRGKHGPHEAIRHKSVDSDNNTAQAATATAAAAMQSNFGFADPDQPKPTRRPVGLRRASEELGVSQKALEATRGDGEVVTAVNTTVSGQVEGNQVEGVIPLISRRPDGSLVCETFDSHPNGIRLDVVTAHGSGVAAIGPDTSTGASELSAMASVIGQQRSVMTAARVTDPTLRESVEVPVSASWERYARIGAIRSNQRITES